ncbi:hypothetical protein B6U80_01100 [Candidatus Pacearchaeota archaeon ex4484_26]|nr:MAG: hypothetical protein B6U80_01100 [Candidatus Pacearchaeota archaeon ex4484_26]
MPKASDLEKAQFLFKLIRGKRNWMGCYDRIEHFKRFSKEAIKELVKSKWLILTKKAKFKAISVNTKFKKEIIEFIEKNMPYLKGTLR